MGIPRILSPERISVVVYFTVLLHVSVGCVHANAHHIRRWTENAVLITHGAARVVRMDRPGRWKENFSQIIDSNDM